MASVIDLNPCIYLRDTIKRKKDLMKSIVELPPDYITLDDLYNMALDIQRLETRLKLQIKQPRLL